MADPDAAFEELLEFVRDARAFDYTAYKRPSLIRRFDKRMQEVRVESYEDYRDYLEAEPREFHELFNTILINVTRFFRDPPAWEFLAADVIPRLLSSRSGTDPLRVWSAGCATGEEAYSVAILLAEQLEEKAFRERVKIYATDVDDEALTAARHAVYSPRQVEAVPVELRSKYFQDSNGSCAVRGDLRRAVIFGRNDLISDPPISRVDLLISRNTLMYFGAPAQERVLANFFFALNPEGFLFLGKAEALMSRTTLFGPFNLKHRVFEANDAAGRELPLRAALPAVTETRVERTDASLSEVSFDHSPSAQLLVDTQGRLSLANHEARALFGLSSNDIGRLLSDLEVSYRPLDLRSLIDQVKDQRRPLVARDVTWSVGPDNEQKFDVAVGPLTGPDDDLVGVSIFFADVSRSTSMRDDLERARRELESAYEELQSTVEELETTNEELQSTNEELETTNEELQSTNEELETMNEELQSTNEELETMNDEMRDRTDEAVHANSFLGSILASIQQSVVVVDPDLRVTAWSQAASDLWGLRSGEVEGEFFLNLDIGLPVGDLRTPIRRVLAGESVDDLELEARDRRGRPITAQITLSALKDHRDEPRGALMVMTPRGREDSS